MSTIDAFLAKWTASGAAERAAEKAAGHIRWLRPEYQAPSKVGVSGVQRKLLEVDEGTTEAEAPAPAGKREWPETLPAQAAAFEGKRTPKLLEQIRRLLETLVALEQAEEVRPGVWGRS